MTIPNLAQQSYYLLGEFDNGTVKIVSYAGDAGGQGGDDVPLEGPQLTLTQPSGSGNVRLGTTMTIAWSNTIPGDNPKVQLFYVLVADKDTPAKYTNIENNVNPNGLGTAAGAGRTYSWQIPDNDANLTGGPWCIGAIITADDGSKTAATFAPGTFTIIDRNSFAKDLSFVEGTKEAGYSDAIGRTFQGFSPNGKLGGIVGQVPWKYVPDPKDPAGLRREPGISMNGDEYDDFILTAPTGNPFYLQRKGAGESYLVLSDPVKLFSVPVVGALEPISVSATGTSVLPGVMFSGPASTGATSGIGAVTLSRPLDTDDHGGSAHDGKPSVVFGLPDVNKTIQEEQDYDPWDAVEYDIEADYRLGCGSTTLLCSLWGYVSGADRRQHPQSRREADKPGRVGLVQYPQRHACGSVRHQRSNPGTTGRSRTSAGCHSPGQHRADCRQTPTRR